MTNNQKGCTPTLADVRETLKRSKDLSPVRIRDLSSAIARFSELIGEEPDRIPLDLAQIRDRLNAINPVANGISPKSFANIRSNLFAAITASRLKPISRARPRLTEPWRALRSGLTTVRHRIDPRRIAPSQAKRASPRDDRDLERGRERVSRTWPMHGKRSFVSPPCPADRLVATT